MFQVTPTNNNFDKLRINHHLALDTCLDDIQVDSEQLFFENPYPISKPQEPLPNHFDNLMIEKRKFLREIEAYRKDFKRDKRKIPTRFNQKVQYAVLPRYLVNVCTHKAKDPDVYFPDDRDYNWYYTGGVLDCVKVNDCEYVVTPDGEDNLVFTKFNSHVDASVMECFNVRTGPIYALKSSVISSDSLLFTLRQKYEVSVILANFLNESKPDGCLLLKQESDIPYCDATINSDLSSLCTFRVDGQLEIRDISSGKQILRHHHQFDNSNLFSFGQINCIDTNTLVYSDRNELIITDNRLSENTRSRLKDSYCNEICTFLCHSDLFIYVATKHNLIKYDLRKAQPIANYVHMLASEPYLISSVRMGSSDMICLANQNSKVLMQCTEEKGLLPLSLPSVNDTFDEMQRKEKVHIYRHLEERLSSPTIGLKLRKLSENTMIVFSCNTAGDIYQQQISTNRINTNPRRKLSDWIDGLPQIETEFAVTGVADMSDVRFALSKSLNNKKLKRYARREEDVFKIDGELYEGESHFGSHLEQIWLTEGVLDEEVFAEMDVSNKVSSWLGTQHNYNGSQ